MADRPIVQKAEAPFVRTSGLRVARTTEPKIALLPDCGRPVTKPTVVKFHRVYGRRVAEYRVVTVITPNLQFPTPKREMEFGGWELEVGS